jgi:uncharacterized low-complexity protein
MARISLRGPISAVLGTALLTTAASAAPTASDAFGIVDLPSGHVSARMHADEGKCGEGKCGGAGDESDTEGKCGEGKCGSDGGKGDTEGKCGEGKCGGAS